MSVEPTDEKAGCAANAPPLALSTNLSQTDAFGLFRTVKQLFVFCQSSQRSSLTEILI